MSLLTGVSTASSPFTSAAGHLCCAIEMLKTVNRYLLRLGGGFFVGKWQYGKILAGNLVLLLDCCSAVLCQALQ